ncbi:NF-kappa-B inhibitor-interacting Ras-like protein 1 isoform X2 [Mesocricetus auratus]|uniref:NF-kappa-B inhibitor-interacting Ras-like protein 1 isoform X2 n=1 Tax=Mesocricetus auratus TaxID=10036 RepID=A0ABM2XNC9_MESAU|nr:NF-kappa-B inhibitor-interacting Ras-like protein 1 isoform X2 [Mesocricetus auratus]
MGKSCKVVVCGLLSVGKTAILEQLLYGNHTIGVEDCETMEDVYMASVETDRGVKEQLHLYDTRGLQEGVELPKHYFSFADGFVLVYSVNNLESFQRVELLKKEIDKFKDKKESLSRRRGLSCLPLEPPRSLTLRAPARLLQQPPSAGRFHRGKGIVCPLSRTSTLSTPLLMQVRVMTCFLLALRIISI